MRDTKINVLYYPDFAPAAEATLKKALLLFDELHVMDRPSFSFGRGQHGGLIGAPSPFRDFETFFKNERIPIYVHHAPGGPVPDEFYEQIKADVNDLEFLKRFQSGLKTSPVFRSLQIPAGNYGAAGNQDSVVQKLIAVDLVTALETYESPIVLFEDSTILPFDVSNPVAPAKWLIFQAAMCSSKLNFALRRSTSLLIQRQNI